MSQEKIIIIIPTFNEAANLPALLQRLNELNHQFKILIVDDNSPDGTGQIASALMNQYDWLETLIKPNKEGLGAAYKTGFTWALQHGATILGEMDADLSHQPEDLPKLIKATETGAQIVIGSRRIPGGKIVGWSLLRRLESWGATTLARLILGLKTKDLTSGFRLYHKNVLEQIPWPTVTTSGYAWQEELLYYVEKLKLKIVEVPITFVDRKYGKSKLSLKDIIEFFTTIFRLRFNNTNKL